MPPFRFGQKGGQKLVRGNLFVKIPLKKTNFSQTGKHYLVSGQYLKWELSIKQLYMTRNYKAER